MLDIFEELELEEYNISQKKKDEEYEDSIFNSSSKIDSWIKETLLVEDGWKSISTRLTGGGKEYVFFKLDGNNLILTYNNHIINEHILKYAKFLAYTAGIKMCSILNSNNKAEIIFYG